MLAALLAAASFLAPSAAGADAVFARQIAPILEARCAGCHGEDQQRGGLRVDARDALLRGGASGPAIVPGDPAAGALLERVRGAGPRRRMPASGDALAPADVAALERWIAAGAPWPEAAALGARHWSLVPPQRPLPPRVAGTAWCRNPIDAFVLARLERERLPQNPEADRATLLRRVSLDLTGLPPTLAELDRFLADGDAGAYEREVDRLLASPRYGEEFARDWLDLARYADTNGYEKDLPRSLWPWRDWVIRSLNADLPFDRFTVEQLAGDLLPGATRDQLVATGFHRNTLLNDEGGADPEEFRVAAVVDRVNTTATVWLGLTLGCAQCHDHKYDPFSQREYYELLAFFDQTEDGGVGNGPELPVPSPEQERALAALDARSAEISERLAAAGPLPPPAAGPDVPPPVVRADAGEFAGAGDFEAGDAFSYGAWVRPSGPGCVLSRIDDTAAYRGFDLFFHEQRFQVHLAHRWPDAAIKVESARTFANGDWHHVLASYDGSGKAAGVRLFVDGAPEPLEVRADALAGTLRTGVALRIGSRHASGAWQGELADARLYAAALDAAAAAEIAREGAAAAGAPPERARALWLALAPEGRALADERAALVAERAAIRVPTTMVLRERAEPRATHVHLRGNHRTPGAAVAPGTPAALHPFPRFLARNRLTFASWLVDERNPLLARVAMNRSWAHFFGRGLVATQEDFGVQGDPPSHPELLDWLATEFRASGWSQKALHRLIVTSATYRQSAVVRRDHLERDPANVLLARLSRLRLAAEAVRDHALAVSGLLDDRIGGPSVMPFQPDGTWVDSFANFDTPDLKWTTADGPDRHRRGLYTYLRRSAIYPASLVFDGPRRDVCLVQRSRTTTPLQALVTLNDPVYVEAAEALARRMRGEPAPGASAAERIAHGHRLAVARRPEPAELAALAGLLERALASGAGEDEAYTAVANVLLNLDEALTRG